jgi:hypothetical protein
MPSYILLLTLTSLLLLVACQPATIAPAPTPTAPIPTLTPTQRAVTPDVAPTAIEDEPTPTSPPATPTPTGAPVTPEATPTAAPTSPPPSETSANADVEFVRAVEGADGTWTFHVTVRHPDTGWEDYADGWDVLTPDGTVIQPDPSSPFTRLLLHPHETEQPFTRSQSGIVIPPAATQVRVRAHDLVDGFGGREVVVDLTFSSGPDFEVERK